MHAQGNLAGPGGMADVLYLAVAAPKPIQLAIIGVVLVAEWHMQPVISEDSVGGCYYRQTHTHTGASTVRQQWLCLLADKVLSADARPRE